MSINQNLSRTHPGPVSINKNLSKTHPGPVSINRNVCRTPPGSRNSGVFFHENLNWQHSDRQSIFFNKNSCNPSFYVIFSSKLNNYKKIMYQCMSIYIVTLFSIFIHQRSAADRRPALHSSYARKTPSKYR